jgi:hypothetical protein
MRLVTRIESHTPDELWLISKIARAQAGVAQHQGIVSEAISVAGLDFRMTDDDSP